MKIHIDLVTPSPARTIAKRCNKPVWGRVFSDRMFLAEWNKERGWHRPRVSAYAPIPLDPAANVLHYAQQVFEGLKAHRLHDGQIALFRPEKHGERLDRSAARLCMPAIGPELFHDAIFTLIGLERAWVPACGKGSLYIRPTIIATEAVLGVRVSATFLFYVIVGPVGPYFPTGFKPVKIYVEPSYVRSAVGSIGAAKSAGNYAASLLPGKTAHDKGCDQVLFLDALEHRYLEELGGMNVFCVRDGALLTPPLSGSILPGVTRASILELAPRLGIKAEERPIALDELLADIESGSVTEMFAAGTAAVVTSIGSLIVKDRVVRVTGDQVGPVAARLYEQLSRIHRGEVADELGWMQMVPEAKAGHTRRPAKTKRRTKPRRR
jgi:branched-chain amino acid aminotransferase